MKLLPAVRSLWGGGAGRVLTPLVSATWIECMHVSELHWINGEIARLPFGGESLPVARERRSARIRETRGSRARMVVKSGPLVLPGRGRGNEGCFFC